MSSEASAHGGRTTCEQCGLPYYVEHGACPYCEPGSTAEGIESNAEVAARPRTSCDSCGLPYYTEENENCPYCEHASTGTDATVTEPAPRHRADATDRRGAETSETGPSLLKRISNRVRGVLSSR